jgi:hypothetical protein
VKKWVSILLLGFYLVSTTEGVQLLKIPILIMHFRDHQQQNPALTFVAFMKMHYHHPKKDADYKTDRKLPFVSHSIHFGSVFTLNPVFRFVLKKEAPVVLKSEISSKREIYYVNSILQSIWQPPKFSSFLYGKNNSPVA